MHTFKRSMLVVAMLGGVFALSGCGGGGSSSDDDSKNQEVGQDQGSVPNSGSSSSEFVPGKQIEAAEASTVLVGRCVDSAKVGFASERFEVFSASDAMQAEDLQVAATIAEVAVDNLMQKLSIESNEIFGTSIDQPISICLESGGDTNGEAFIGGFKMDAPSPGQFSLDESNYSSLLRHELIHVMQSRIVYGVQGPKSFDVHRWFSEGLATLFSGQEVDTNPSEINEYLDKVESGQALAAPEIETYGQWQAEGEPSYRIFSLAVHYLVADAARGGAGHSLASLAEAWRVTGESLDAGSSAEEAFAEAFDQVFHGQDVAPGAEKLTLQFYADSYESLIRDFLSTAWVDGSVAGTGASDVDMAFVFEKDQSFVEGKKHLSSSDLESGSFSVLSTVLDPSQEYDVYFVDILEETETTIKYREYGPLPLYLNAGDTPTISANAPGGPAVFDITNADSEIREEED